MIVKILGLFDLVAAMVFLMLIFNIPPFIQLTLFTAGILFIKGLFVLQGDVLSAADLIASITLIISIFFTPWVFLIWTLAFLLLSKGFVSFL
tara:strand:+ start:4870 stop:5145 length:276 start_codon:yes stop_codon:yes gene_type:complete